MVVFERHPGPPKIKFSANMTPTSPQLGLQMDQVFGAWGPVFWSRRLHFSTPGPQQQLDPHFVTILVQFWTDFGHFLDRCWMIFQQLLEPLFMSLPWSSGQGRKTTSYFACLLLANLPLIPSPQFWLLSFSSVATQLRLQNFRPHARPGGMRAPLRIRKHARTDKIRKCVFGRLPETIRKFDENLIQ